MRRQLLRRTAPAAKAFTPEPYIWQQPNFGTNLYGGNEQVENNFLGYVQGAYKRNGIVFACIQARQLVFSEARFQFQRLQGGRPGDMFGTAALSLLETPWVNGTTGDLLSRMEQDASLAGNFFAVVRKDRAGKPWLSRLSPDRVTIVAGSREDDDPEGLSAELLGYVYKDWAGREATLDRKDVVHYAPTPDPEARYRGMSWLTPVVREITADNAATTHKFRFFENGATPSTVITYDKSVDPTRLQEFAAAFRLSHAGTDNAYKTLHLAGGADIKAFGGDLKQIDFKAVQGAGETRIAAASGVGSIIAQFSEGMAGSSLNAGNYSAARRRFGDMTMRPLWRSAAASLATAIEVPAGSQLWYDDRHIPFLQEDRKDAAEIQGLEATTIRTLVDGGFEPASVIAAVRAEDMSLLTHTGRTSVQLQLPGIEGDQPS